MREALDIVLRREHLNKTLKIAFLVGCVLTVINQLDVFLGGNATAGTWVKTGLNFCVPFVVSNLGLLAGKRSEKTDAAGGDREVGGEPSAGWSAKAGAPPAEAEAERSAG